MKKIILSLCFATGMLTAGAQTADKAGSAPPPPAQSAAAADVAAPAKPENQNGPKFSFKNGNTFDFGDIKESPSGAEHNFEFTNTGKEPLIITAATPSCSCTVPDFPKEPILPGKKGVIKVHFNSAGHPGQFIKSVWLSSNANNQNRYELVIKGTVAATTPATPGAPARQ